jgi:nitroreductase
MSTISPTSTAPSGGLAPSARTARTATPIHDLLAERWSPRAFDATAVLDDSALDAALEAARWAPSAGNTQPWRFIVARRGTEDFAAIEASLMGFNAVWAGSAGAFVVAVAETVDENGAPRRWAEYDVGQAMAHFSIQAHSTGHHVHQLGGFDVDALRASFGLAEDLVPMTVSAVGTVGSPDLLPERTRERETAPRTRLPLEDLLLHRAS